MPIPIGWQKFDPRVPLHYAFHADYPDMIIFHQGDRTFLALDLQGKGTVRRFHRIRNTMATIKARGAGQTQLTIVKFVPEENKWYQQQRSYELVDVEDFGIQMRQTTVIRGTELDPKDFPSQLDDIKEDLCEEAERRHLAHTFHNVMNQTA